MKRLLLLFSIFFSSIILLNAQTKNLEFYLQQATNNSPLLKDYQNQILLNGADSERIAASYKPRVSGNSFNTFAPNYKGFGYDYAITNGGNLSAMIGVTKTLVSKQNLNTQFQNLHLQNQSANNASKISEQELKKEIAAQYITAYGDLQQLNFNKDVNDLLNKEEKILKILTSKNVYRQTDYLTFLVTLQQQQLAVRQLQIQFSNDFASLNYLCGIIDTTAFALEEPVININNLPEISNSAFFQKYVIDSMQLNNAKDLIGFSYKPKVNLYGDGGFNSAFSYEGYKNFGASVGVSLVVPIYDGHQKQIQYKKVDIEERTRVNYKDFFSKQYNQQIAQLTQQLNETNELIEEVKAQLKYSQALIDVNEKLIETGDARITDFVLALNNYLNAKNLLTQNNITRLQIINQINYWNR